MTLLSQMPNCFSSAIDMSSMHRRHLLALLVALVALITVSATLIAPGPAASNPLSSDQQYPDGVGPNHINFSTLNADGRNVSYTPREYWESYAIIYTEPPERRRVEGNYYINSSTGEIISDLWHGATDYRYGKTYAYVQPADSIPNEDQREEFKSDESFVYDSTTDAYYRYDPYYGRIAPTTIGRHTDILEFYTWEAINTTTHHGVPVITYQVTGKRTNSSRVPPTSSGTLRLGVEDGIVYAFDIALDESEGNYHYTYDVRPVPFPDHEWVETAQDVATTNTTSNSSPERQQRHVAW